MQIHCGQYAHLSEAVPERSWKVSLASICCRIHSSQQAEIGVAGDGHHITPLCNCHAASAAFQQTCYPLKSLNSNNAASGQSMHLYKFYATGDDRTRTDDFMRAKLTYLQPHISLSTKTVLELYKAMCACNEKRRHAACLEGPHWLMFCKHAVGVWREIARTVLSTQKHARLDQLGCRTLMLESAT